MVSKLNFRLTEKDKNTTDVRVRETNAHLLAIVSSFWDERVENWPRWVELCIEHIRDICFRVSPPKI